MSNLVQAVKLLFNGGLHIGRGAEELDKTATTYGSDALKSALFAVGLPYYPEWGENPERFFKAFSISSVFPWYGNELFLPKPGNIRFHFEQSDDLTDAKKAKKISYLSAGIFRNWVKDPDELVKIKQKHIGDSSFLFTENANKFLHIAVQQRVQMPAGGEGGDTRPYYFERLLFAENSGLYFLISFHDDEIRPKIMHVLNILGDIGIGTDRTVGNGQFTVDSLEEFEIPIGHRGLQMTLGLYLPEREELETMNLEESHWNLLKRGGYIAASQNPENRSLRKNNIYFFGEGSTFKSSAILKGRFVDLQPSNVHTAMHPVWRCGMPLFINL